MQPCLASTVATAQSASLTPARSAPSAGSFSSSTPSPGSSEARRYCKAPSSSTADPSQKPPGGQGGTRSNAATRSCRKPSTVCTSCVMRRFGARPASCVQIQREATFRSTPPASTDSNHGSGLLTCMATREPTLSHWLGKRNRTAQTCVTKTCSSTLSPKRANASLSTDVYKAYERVEMRHPSTPRTKLVLPEASGRDCATPACCMD
mmetsp:Transcript_92920/g.258782  ORF Transcript_92920/g.258782 Transcript_92920/m.258782 type:complete len:207 (+) Transcript_92920:437-1057(+)